MRYLVRVRWQVDGKHRLHRRLLAAVARQELAVTATAAAADPAPPLSLDRVRAPFIVFSRQELSDAAALVLVPNFVLSSSAGMSLDSASTEPLAWVRRHCAAHFQAELQAAAAAAGACAPTAARDRAVDTHGA